MRIWEKPQLKQYYYFYSDCILLPLFFLKKIQTDRCHRFSCVLLRQVQSKQNVYAEYVEI